MTTSPIWTTPSSSAGTAHLSTPPPQQKTPLFMNSAQPEQPTLEIMNVGLQSRRSTNSASGKSWMWQVKKILYFFSWIILFQIFAFVLHFYQKKFNVIAEIFSCEEKESTKHSLVITVIITGRQIILNRFSGSGTVKTTFFIHLKVKYSSQQTVWLWHQDMPQRYVLCSRTDREPLKNTNNKHACYRSR